VVRYVLISELNVLSQAAHRIAMADRHSRDFTLLGLTLALTEIVCAFPVYRTYLTPATAANVVAERVVRAAVRLARLRNPAQGPTPYAFFEDLLLLRLKHAEQLKEQAIGFALRFQQLTGPIMAKAVEDTAFYRYTRLVALNEVGGSPAKFGTSLREFHRDNAERARSWPLSMITTATHDSKRGEDAAARIAVISELPQLWERSVRRWQELASFARSVVNDQAAPEASLEYLFYQALVGAWPFGADPRQLGDLKQRLPEYLLKAAREAKTETSWLSSNGEYEAKLTSFVHRMLQSDVFLNDVARFCREIDAPAACNGLAQVVLRLCSPGVPDTYQGGELWNQSLVDPDNRRAVDYGLRRRHLTDITAKLANRKALLSELLDGYADGRIKLYVMHLALQLRRGKPDLFVQGDYVALDGGEHVVAFTRGFESERLVCVVPHLSAKLTRGAAARFPIGKVWAEQALQGLEPGKYYQVFTGEFVDVRATTPLAELLADFPVAVLVKVAP
jgi:(1->4)-alpha-D-glucan 1-alpha-D-glucosylmutase